MNKLFRNFVLLPNIFLVILFGALTLSSNPLHYLLMVVIVSEHIFFWNINFENNTNDIRVFFPEQYLKILYNILIFAIYGISFLIWSLISWWCLFIYFLNYLILRTFASTGIEALENIKSSPSEYIKPDIDIWKFNKTELLKLCQNCMDISLKESIINEIEYSSFMRSEIAKEKISSAKSLQGSDLENFLKSFKDYL